MSASESSSVIDMPHGLEQVLDALKGLEHSELLKVIKNAATEAEKRSKGGKITKTTKAKKEPGVKRAVPNQLKKNHAWIANTLAHAIDNGWESFTIHQSKKNKLTGEKEEEEIEMPAAVQNESGAWVYDGSITEKTPGGRQINHKEAMSLSKMRKELNHETWQEFDASYVPEEIPETASEASDSNSKVVKKMTAAEKEAEKEAKKAAKEAEKEAKKAAKEAEKEAKKAEKEAEKEAKKKEKDAGKKVKAPSAPVPAGGAAAALAAKKVAEPTEPAEKPTEKPKAAPKAAPKAVVKKASAPVEEWVPPAEGSVKKWNFKGKNYLRSSDNGLWLVASDGSVGDWVGVYLPAEGRIDDSAEEPDCE
jgi:hypothetical protein